MKITKEKNVTETQLRMALKFNMSTFLKLTKIEMISLDVLVQLCRVFKCQLSNICTTDFGGKV